MTRIIAIFLTALCVLGSAAQNVRTCEHTMAATSSGINNPLKEYREINSGSKFIVKYEGDIPESLKGAFEYAVKIWEETLPPTIPITILVKVDKLRGSSSKSISKVNFLTDVIPNCSEWYYDAPITMMKGALMMDYIINGTPIRFEPLTRDASVIYGAYGEDINITYNKDLLDECSFSLKGNPYENKYDFVTIAMRDIAMGLGLLPNIQGDNDKGELVMTNEKYTPYETLVLNSLTGGYGEIQLNFYDKAGAFRNATAGSVMLTRFYRRHGGPCNDVALYAPATWDKDKSLKFMIPCEGNPITYLLSHELGKGDIMRDLSGFNMQWFFQDVLDWNNEIATSEPIIYQQPTGNSDDVIPYTGSFQIPFDYNRPYMSANEDEASADTRYMNGNNDSGYPDVMDILSALNPYSPSRREVGTSLSALKNDGLWDVLFTTDHATTINIGDYPLHEDEANYARGTTGGLRYRLTQCYKVPKRYDTGYRYAYDTKYFTRDFTPQTPVIKYSQIHGGEQRSNMRGISLVNDDDDYFVDVEIGMSHMEGATRVVVEQLDEGEVLPFQYDVEDISQGYFLANLDRECATDITIIAYNSNGHRRSNTIHIEPIGYPATEAEFSLKGDCIVVSGISARKLASGNVTYGLNTVLSNRNVSQAKTLTQKEISIADLLPGVYVMSVYDKNVPIGTFKFKK